MPCCCRSSQLACASPAGSAPGSRAVATVERVELGGGWEGLCAAADGVSFVGGLELSLGRRLRELPSNRYAVYD